MGHRSVLPFLASLILSACTIGPRQKDEEEPFYRLMMLSKALDNAADEASLKEIERQIGALANRHVALFITRLRHGDPERKVLAAFGLGYAHTKRKTLIPIMLNSMRDGSPDVRRMAAASLGNLKPDPTEIVLRRILELADDPHPKAREGAFKALQAILGPGQHFGTLPVMHEHLSDEDFLVRNQVVICVMIVKSAESTEPVVRQLQAEPSPHVRANIALTLEAIGDERANNALIDLLKDPDPDVVKFAHYSLNKINRVELSARNQDLNRAHAVWREWWERVQQERAALSSDMARAEMCVRYEAMQEAIQIYLKYRDSRDPDVRQRALEGLEGINETGMKAYGTVMKINDPIAADKMLKQLEQQYASTEAGDRARKARDSFLKAKAEWNAPN